MAAFLDEARHLATKAGLDTGIVSVGGTPDMWKDDGLEHINEYRAGTYIYCDRSLAERGTCTYDDCALTVLCTVVSTPTNERALIDAGSKALTSDLLGLTGYGCVRALDGVRVYDQSEEHGFLDVSRLNDKPSVGDVVRVTPSAYDYTYTVGGNMRTPVPISANLDENVARFARVLKPGGTLRFASDIDTYVEWTLVRLLRNEHFNWLAEKADDWRLPWPGFPGTRYEQKAFREGRKPAYLEFRRL